MSKTLAVIKLGGHQYLVTPGARVVVNRLASDEGTTLKLEDILSAQDVKAKVLTHQLGEKVRGLKFKPKTRYLKRYGHRQMQTIVEIVSIGNQAPDAKVAPELKPAAKKTVTKRAVAKKPASKVVKKDNNG